MENNFLSDAAAASWKRYHEFGLVPTDPIDDDILTGIHMQSLLKQNEQTIQYTEQIFEHMHVGIKESGQMALLIDPEGTIIHTAGDIDFSRRALAVQLQVGANWAEHRKGTNAIGVALTERKPVRVHAEEHYFQSNHFLTCASAPVFNAIGELIGIVNISGKQENFHAYTFSLACLAAQSLQNKFLLEESKKEHLITLRELDYSSMHHPLPLLSLSRDNRILRANHAAMRIMGSDVIGKLMPKLEGFAVQTLHNEHQKLWQSVSIRKVTGNDQHLYTFHDLVGTCPTFLQRKELAQKASTADFPVLLLGESGVGKELFAQSIHTASSRSGAPFIALNCSAIPDSLVESELFGYARGAFTGASKEGNIGKFEAAHKGTIFLDEIGDMPLRAQAALLRVLQDGRITPVGSAKSKTVDVRVIAATNKDLAAEVKAGGFRADLYYRLKGIPITLPALRERSDILALALHLLQKHASPCCAFTEAAKRKLLAYNWPGNVRELSGILMQAIFLAGDQSIDADHLMLEAAQVDETLSEPPSENHPLTLKEAEIKAIKMALTSSEWNLSKAAAKLQIGRTTLYRKIEEYGIT
ncbi:sigma-54-dependent Fis family transcriptional regulator [Paenibacillus chondroitinus]|uniref:Sigma-54-dependent Fis family transcriptional regulator n=1 Tax=Paenibacillus chondroitinus TaxID=59842 RepID=A0ABU6DL51_9BACL|nr:sigma-54-dependent Fis family transcriptional regulator [Paenibacillus chondroitinus]MCY9657770.1 sigma-54-dependent Fis family transcriptional regulator [Paenibacillus anseongense]MEB4797537.1 sigma-54-dependent Fis family transcriptional regulator [Paenibacillus chondroitinus]